MWQAAYAEFVFMDLCWPDFEPRHLSEAIEDYGNRDRRFGGLTKHQEAANGVSERIH
ncbi:MAG: undecaprenyl diphosphate synthase family protein [Bdellovibrionota bacterium]